MTKLSTALTLSAYQYHFLCKTTYRYDAFRLAHLFVHRIHLNHNQTSQIELLRLIRQQIIYPDEQKFFIVFFITYYEHLSAICLLLHIDNALFCPCYFKRDLFFCVLSNFLIH